MNRRLQLIVAAVFAVIAVLLISLYLKKAKESITAGMEEVKVLAAKEAIPANTKLDEDMLKYRKIPERFVHRNALTPRDLDLILGQLTRYRIEKDEVILWNDLGVTETGGSVSEIVRENERAITIAVDEVTSVGNLIRPNDSVDILGTFAVDGTGMATITLLQNVTILAVGGSFGSMSRDASMGYRTVTVSVTPLEAEILVFAQERGKLSLSLRNNRDLGSALEIPKVTWEDVYKTEKRATIQRQRDIRIIKGKER